MRHPAFRAETARLYSPTPNRVLCACGVCGRSFSTNTRGSKFHPSCRELRPCECGCGLRYPPTCGRRFHPQCPTRAEGWHRYRDKKLLADGPKATKRCAECEDMPWRRPKRRDCLCGKRFEPEVIERDSDRSPLGCGLAFIE